MAKASRHQVLKPAEQGVAVQIVIQRERRQASLQLKCCDVFLSDHPGLCSAVNTKEGEVLALGKRGEFPADSRYSVRLME
jgi:hypothetical protein